MPFKSVLPGDSRFWGDMPRPSKRKLIIRENEDQRTPEPITLSDRQIRVIFDWGDTIISNLKSGPPTFAGNMDLNNVG